VGRGEGGKGLHEEERVRSTPIVYLWADEPPKKSAAVRRGGHKNPSDRTDKRTSWATLGISKGEEEKRGDKEGLRIGMRGRTNLM